MDLENYIEIKSPLPLEKVADEVRKADIGLVLVKKDLYTDIIHRNKLYEFIACKVPLVVTKTQLLSQFFSDNQLLFLKDNTPGELFAAIINLSKDKKYRHKLANNAFSYYQKYNWQKEKKKYFALIKSMQ
jgi:glycosyltransferase involved in cell wall biosynthesis